MKQSKNILFYLVLIYFIGCIIYFLLYNYSIVHLSPDAERFLCKSINSEYVTDWHSSLYLYECILIKRALSIIGYSFSPSTIIGISGILSAFITWANMLLWTYWLSRTLAVYIIIIFPLFILFILSNISIGTDQIFLSFLFTGISFTFIPPRIKRRHYVIFIIIFSFTMIHMLTMRRNALLICPIITFLAFNDYFKIIRASIRCFLSVILSGMYYIMATSAISYGFPVLHTHPLVPMMVSEMRTAAILDGTIGNGDNPYADSLGNGIYVTKLMSTPIFPEANALGCRGEKIKEEQQHWQNILKLYIKTWKKSPRSISCAHTIHFFLFLTSNYMPKFIQHLICLHHPHCAIDQEIWKHNNFLRCSVFRIFARLIPLLMPFYLFHIYRKSRSLPISEEDKLLSLFGIIAFLYLLSYAVVTPSADMRYTHASVILGAYVLCCTFVRYAISLRENKQRQSKTNKKTFLE